MTTENKSEAKVRIETDLGKYRETSPEEFADTFNNFGGSYHGDEIRKIRIDSYSQGFHACEMINGPQTYKAAYDEAIAMIGKLELELAQTAHRIDYLTNGFVENILERDRAINDYKDAIDVLKELQSFKEKWGVNG